MRRGPDSENSSLENSQLDSDPARVLSPVGRVLRMVLGGLVFSLMALALSLWMFPDWVSPGLGLSDSLGDKLDANTGGHATGASTLTQWLMVGLFVLTYAAIVLEETLALSRVGSALTGATLMLGVLAQEWHWGGQFWFALGQSIESVGALLVFLMAVMGVLQWMNHHGGLERVLQVLWSSSPRVFLFRVSLASFILSAILDNMTTCLLMLTMLKGRLSDLTMRWCFAGMVVVAANAGGVWSPIGDVTSTMLWLGERLGATSLITLGFWPSLLHCLVVLAITVWQMPNTPLSFMACATTAIHTTAIHSTVMSSLSEPPTSSPVPAFGSSPSEATPAGGADRSLWVLVLGLLSLLAIPCVSWWGDIKPAWCAVIVLGVLCFLVSPILNHRLNIPVQHSQARLWRDISQIDLSSVCFIGAILMCMEAMGHSGVLSVWAQVLGDTLKGPWNTVLVLGFLSAIVDNIPLVSAGMQMFDPSQFPKDDLLWVFLSYCAGTGGSLLIVGSAAGLVAMGQEGLKFNWFLRHFSWKVLLAYCAGAGLFALWVPR